MSAVLRAFERDFDVDAFLERCELPVCAAKRRGEAVYPASQPDGRRHEHSGVHVRVSKTEFEDFPQQVDEATRFLKIEYEQLRRLCEWRGVDGVELDFGINRRDVPVQCDLLTPDLVQLAGRLGLGIVLSQYDVPTKGEEA